jgi:hypothetical protein
VKLIKLTRQSFDRIGKANWEAVCNHTNKIVDDYVSKEPLLDVALEQIEFVVNTGSSDEEEEDDDDDEENVVEPDYDFDLGVSPLICNFNSIIHGVPELAPQRKKEKSS